MKITNKNYKEINFDMVQAIDEHVVTDLYLCMVNNYEVDRQIKQINQGLAKKMKSGMFDEAQAVKAFYNVVESYLSSYNTKRYNNYFYNKGLVSVHDRFMVAYNILIDNMEAIEEYSNYMNISELTSHLKAYYKCISTETKDKLALQLALTIELDDLNKSGKVSDELRDNYTFDKVSKIFK